MFIAVLLTLLLSLLALTIDLGSQYVAQRHTQVAADAGSLAAVEDLPLPSNTTSATTDATNYGHTLNDPTASATSAAPVGGSSCTSSLSYNSTTPSSWAQCFQAQVNVSQISPLPLGLKGFGSSGTVSASAVASVNLTASTSGGNSVPNGNFPTGCSTTQSDPTFCEPGPAAPAANGVTIGTSGTPWTVWYGDVDWAADGAKYVNYVEPPGDSGAAVIDMNGNLDGGISQTVTGLVTGKKYLMSFLLSGNAGNSEPTFTGEVAIGTQLSATPAGQAATPLTPTAVVPTAVCPNAATICIPFSYTDNPANVQSWQPVGIPFTATATSAVISFLSTSSQATVNYENTGPTIADVGVQPAQYSLTQ